MSLDLLWIVNARLSRARCQADEQSQTVQVVDVPAADADPLAGFDLCVNLLESDILPKLVAQELEDHKLEVMPSSCQEARFVQFAERASVMLFIV